MKQQFESEAELAAIGVEHFRAAGFKVYQEVAYSSRTIDFVAVQGALTWIVEVKKSRTMKVLAQADGWIGFANRVSVLVPQASKNGSFFNRVASLIGAGVLEAASARTSWRGAASTLREETAARLYRKTTGRLRDCLHPAQESYCEAGAAGGGRWSPWRDTMDRCVAFVKKNPGCTIREIMEAESHHYGSDKTARSSIAQWLESSHFPIRVELKERRRHFYPSAEEEAAAR